MDKRIRQASVEITPTVSTVGADERPGTERSGIQGTRSHRVNRQGVETHASSRGRQACVGFTPSVPAVNGLEHSAAPGRAVQRSIERGRSHGVDRESEDLVVGRQPDVDGAPGIAPVDALERSADFRPAYNVDGVCGSIVRAWTYRSVKPALMALQLSPPSVLTKAPRPQVPA